MPFVSCNKFNTSQAKQDQAIADLEQELLNKQNALNDCSGNPLAGTVPTCAQMTAAIADAVGGVSTTPTGAAGGDLEGTYPNPTVKDQAIVDAVTGSTAVQTAVAGVFNRCDGTDMPAGASLIECSAKGTDIPYLVGGVIPASQLPAYVDDVLEFPALANFPATGEAGKIYIDAGTGKTYRWNGTGYTEISASAGITVQDEGSVLTTAATSLNFVGSGINATSSGGAVTVTANYGATQYLATNDADYGLTNSTLIALDVPVSLTSTSVTKSGGADIVVNEYGLYEISITGVYFFSTSAADNVNLQNCCKINGILQSEGRNPQIYPVAGAVTDTRCENTAQSPKVVLQAGDVITPCAFINSYKVTSAHVTDVVVRITRVSSMKTGN